MYKNGKNKIFVEFFGVNGSGKSTLINEVVKCLNLNGFQSIDSSRVRAGNKKKSLISFFLGIKKSSRIFLVISFYLLIGNYNLIFSGKSIKKWLKSWRRLLFLYRLSTQKDFNYCFSERVLLLILSLSKKEKILDLVLNFNYFDKVYFVFVDTPISIAYQRRKAAEKNGNLESLISTKGQTWVLQYYEDAYNEVYELYSFLLERRELSDKFEIIRLNGENTIESNVSLLFDKLV